MKILVGCEESQAVTKELRLLGHEAFSCDLLPESGGHPEWHLQHDVTDLLKLKWDMIIAFPPCTYLTVTGNRWFNIERYGEQAIQRHKDREFAIKFFKNSLDKMILSTLLEISLPICSIVPWVDLSVSIF